ncbi:hypothetical protein GCM10028815_15830 [Mariniluteicoccus flavus]
MAFPAVGVVQLALVAQLRVIEGQQVGGGEARHASSLHEIPALRTRFPHARGGLRSTRMGRLAGIPHKLDQE